MREDSKLRSLFENFLSENNKRFWDTRQSVPKNQDLSDVEYFKSQLKTTENVCFANAVHQQSRTLIFQKHWTLFFA